MKSLKHSKQATKNICEIGKERIRRAGKKILEENKENENISNLDIGFRVLKLDETNMNNVYFSPKDYNQNLLDILENNIRRTEQILIYFCLPS